MARVETHFASGNVERKEQERSQIVEVLKANGYPQRFIERAAHRQERPCSIGTDKTHAQPANNGWVSIPYVRGLSEAMANIWRPLGLWVAHRAAQCKWTLCSFIKDRVPEHQKKGHNTTFAIGLVHCRAETHSTRTSLMKSSVQNLAHLCYISQRRYVLQW